MKQNLILLHGALGSKTQFESLKKILSEHFSIFIFDFEGHGGNPTTRDYSMGLFSQNLETFMNENELNKSNLFGYSMGGYVAMVFAKHNPEKVDKIITLGTKFDWTPELAAKEIKMLNPDKIKEKVPQFATILSHRHYSLNWEDVLLATAKMMMDLGNGMAMTPSDFSTIAHDALILIGGKDNMVTVGESQKIADILPKGELKILTEFPHPIEKVDENKLVENILAFLKN